MELELRKKKSAYWKLGGCLSNSTVIWAFFEGKAFLSSPVFVCVLTDAQYCFENCHISRSKNVMEEHLLAYLTSV